MPKTAKLQILGQVQGVGLRYSLTRFAQKKGLKGWVRNEPDGSVCCCLQNNQAEVDELVKWLKNNKNKREIEKIDLVWIDEEAKYQDFMIIY